PFTLISDENDKIRETYGAKGLLIPARVTFVINPEGRIVLIYSSQMNPTSHVKQVLNVLSKK
ncbi:MAG: peroxiredoxin, partial [Metallosphaera sp.]